MHWLRQLISLWLVLLAAAVGAQSGSSTTAGATGTPSSSSGSSAPSSSTNSSSMSSTISTSSGIASPTGILYSNNPNIGITNTLNLNTKTYSYEGPSLITIAKKTGGAMPTGRSGIGKAAVWGAAGAGMLVLAA